MYLFYALALVLLRRFCGGTLFRIQLFLLQLCFFRPLHVNAILCFLLFGRSLLHFICVILLGFSAFRRLFILFLVLLRRSLGSGGSNSQSPQLLSATPWPRSAVVSCDRMSNCACSLKVTPLQRVQAVASTLTRRSYFCLPCSPSCPRFSHHRSCRRIECSPLHGSPHACSRRFLLFGGKVCCGC